MQEKSRVVSSIAPEYPSSPLKDIETEAASSTVIHAKPPLDEERSSTPIIPDGVGRRVSGSFKVADVTREEVAHSQKPKNADEEHSDDQLEVSREKAVRFPLKMTDSPPITETEDSGEGKSNSQKKFKPTAIFFPKFNNKGTCVASIIVDS